MISNKKNPGLDFNSSGEEKTLQSKKECHDFPGPLIPGQPGTDHRSPGLMADPQLP